VKLIKTSRLIVILLVASIIAFNMGLIPKKYVPDILVDVNNTVLSILERVGDYFESQKEDAKEEVKDIVIDEIDEFSD